MADVIVQLASVRHYLLSFETVDDCNQAGKHLQENNVLNMQIYKNKEITTMQRKQVFLAITFAERITPAKVKALFPPQISYTLVKAVNKLKDNGSSVDGEADFYHQDNTFDFGVYLFGKQLSKAVVADMNRQSFLTMEKEIEKEIEIKQAEIASLNQRIAFLQSQIPEKSTSPWEQADQFRRSTRNMDLSRKEVLVAQNVEPFKKTINMHGDCAVDSASYIMHMMQSSGGKSRKASNQELRRITGVAMRQDLETNPDTNTSGIAYMVGNAIILFEALGSQGDEVYDMDLMENLQKLKKDGDVTGVANAVQVEEYIKKVETPGFFFEEISLTFLNIALRQKSPPWSIVMVEKAPEPEVMRDNPRTIYMSCHPQSTYS